MDSMPSPQTDRFCKGTALVLTSVGLLPPGLGLREGFLEEIDQQQACHSRNFGKVTKENPQRKLRVSR